MQAPSRFNRDFELIVSSRDIRAVSVRPPLRVTFNIDKSVYGGLNKMQCRIYNLTPDHRNALAKEEVPVDPSQRKVINVEFKVGYEKSLEMIFKGTVFRGTNFREGTDMVTEIECLDGGAQMLSAFTSATVGSKAEAVKNICDGMGIGEAKVSRLDELARPKVLVGANARLLDELVAGGATWYIDNEQMFIIKQDEVISRNIPEVSAKTGLLNTPKREQRKITFESLMNPFIKIGGLCSMNSVISPAMNGVYKIDSISYEGDNYGETWIQSVTGRLADNYVVL